MTDQQQTFQSNVMRFNSRCPIIASPPVEAERVRGACIVFLRTRTYGSRIGAARPLWVNTSHAAYAAETAEIPPIPAGTTRGSQLTLRATNRNSIDHITYSAGAIELLRGQP
jgi:hypothetical protein